jgi:hypothetical protein
MSTPPTFPAPDDGEPVEDRIPPGYQPVDSVYSVPAAVHPQRFQPQPMPPATLPTPPRRRWGRRFVGPVAGVALVLVAVVVGLALLANSKPDSATMTVGDCAKITYRNNLATVRKMACSDQAANAKLALRLNNSNADCPTDDYIGIYNSSQGLNYNACFELNVKQGDCLRTTKSGNDKNFTKVACNNHPTVRIYKVVNGSLDPHACSPDATKNDVYTYTQPADLMLCTADANYNPDDATMPVGDCAQVLFDAGGVTVTKLACTDPNANYQLAVRLNDANAKCPGADYASAFNNSYDFNYNACFRLNVKPGDCLKSSDVTGSDNKNVNKVACTPQADLTVDKVVTGRADANACADPDNAQSYPGPDPLTVCLAPPN